MDWFDGMTAFCRTAETGSLTAAARDLGVSRSMVSRRISQLESELGARLLNRTTRSLSLTSAGNLYYAEAERILVAMEQSQQLMRDEVKTAKGLIRMGIPASFGERYVVPELPTFFEENPAVRLSLQVSEGFADLHKDEIDLVMRIGHLEDSSLNGIRLFRTDMVLCASPSYLQVQAVITAPDDLRAHNCLCYRGYGHGDRWLFRWQGKRLEVPVLGAATADSGVTLRELAIRGLGPIYIPRCLIADELATGQLQPLLPEATAEVPALPVWLVFHPDRFQPLRVKRLIDFLSSTDRGYFAHAVAR